MLVILVAPVWAAALAIACIWGVDPQGPYMMTGYVIAALTCFFSIFLSEM